MEKRGQIIAVLVVCLCGLVSGQTRPRPPAEPKPLPLDPVLQEEPICAESTCCKGKGCCPALWTAFNGSCYRYFDQPLNQYAAENYCRRFRTGRECDSNCTGVNDLGHLVSIHSEAEQDFVYAYWRTNQFYPAGTNFGTAWAEYPGIWIGLEDKSTEGTYTWSDNSNLDITCWTTGQPDDYGDNEDCVLSWWWNTPDKDGFWNDVPCTLEYPFMCQLPRY